MMMVLHMEFNYHSIRMCEHDWKGGGHRTNKRTHRYTPNQGNLHGKLPFKKKKNRQVTNASRQAIWKLVHKNPWPVHLFTILLASSFCACLERVRLHACLRWSVKVNTHDDGESEL